MNAHQSKQKSAVVFAYHDIGVRCLEVLLELGVDVGLVVTHQDNPDEHIWFSSVKAISELNHIPVITPNDPNHVDVIKTIARHKPHFLFSFYYRQMICQELLNLPTEGAFNLHGSLLPRYRGRVPVNWAIVHGEKQTGVSLHRMTSKPDAGNLLAQREVPILINDTAVDVFQKLRCAAETLLMDVVPSMLAGNATETPQDLGKGSYFSGRKPADGEIDWSLPALKIHNLIRAVAPPYPGAFFNLGAQRIWILGSYFRGEAAQTPRPRIYYEDGQLWADCFDGLRFMITDWRLENGILDSSRFTEYFGAQLLIPDSGSGIPDQVE